MSGRGDEDRCGAFWVEHIGNGARNRALSVECFAVPELLSLNFLLLNFPGFIQRPKIAYCQDSENGSIW